MATKARPTGRPSKYDPKFCKEVDKYLKENIDLYENDKLKVNLPTTEGFSTFIGVTRSTLYEWEKEHEIFSDSLDKIVLEQKKRLLNSGLSGAYNSTIAKLVLSSNHGLSDKTETDVTSKGQQIQGVAMILDKAYGTDPKDTNTTE